MTEPEDTKSDEPTLRVLVVEDEAIIALDLSMQVEDAGHRVVGTAHDLASCKTQAARHAPDIALMDMRLKGGDTGAAAAAWLRDELDVRCIFVSANLDAAMRAALEPLDPLAFIGKPVLPAHLRKGLKRAAARLAAGG